MATEPDPPLSDPATWGTEEGRAMLRLLWDPPPPPARGPRQKLTLDQVVSAGMDVARREGIDALSMRKVAAELGVGAMSLYTYVPGRDELFELMVDRAWGTRRQIDRDLPWRAQVEQHADAAWTMYQEHPWLVRSNLWRMPMGPNVMDTQESLYRALSLSGLPPHDVVRLSGLVEGHVFANARAAIIETVLASATGVSTGDYWDARSSFWGTYYSEERFPTMTALWSAGAFDTQTGSLDEMRYGLALLLDAVEQHLAA